MLQQYGWMLTTHTRPSDGNRNGNQVKDRDAYYHSLLLINKLLEEFKVKKDDLIPYRKHAL